MSYWNSAAITGGMTMEDAAAALRGGWNVKDDYPSGDVAVLLDKVSAKYNLPASVLNPCAEAIYTYDTYLISDKPQLAAETKASYIDGTPAKAKLFSYLRTKIHQGDVPYPKYNKQQRAARSAAAEARRKRLYDMMRKADVPWFGSNPMGDNGRRPGNYRGLAYWRPSTKRGDLFDRYASLLPDTAEPAVKQTKMEPA